MVKRILKKIFPVTLLKEAFLYYNKAKIHTVDRLLYREHPLKREDFILNRKVIPFREYGIDTDDIQDPVVRSFMNDWNVWKDPEYILKYEGGCLIEPEQGWAITRQKKLLYYSLGLSRVPHLRKPSLKYFFSGAGAHYKALISLRDTGEENYFHFYNDLLAKLYLLREHGVDIRNIPILVSVKAFNKPYFAFFRERHPLLQGLQWKVQDQDPVRADTVYFCKPLTHNKNFFRELVQPFSKDLPPLARQVFLTRDRKRLRFVENMEEMEALCRSLQIEVVDADALTVQEQIELFRSVNLLIGIHGAGLTNMMFRAPHDCTVIELFPPSYTEYLPFHYVLLAKQAGFNYQGMIGKWGANRFSGGMVVDAAELRQLILQHRARQAH